MHRRRHLTLALALPVIAGLAACGSDSTSSTASTSSASSESSESSTQGSGGANSAGTPLAITAQGFAFAPATTKVPAGGPVTVSFSNKDTAEHSFTLDDNSATVDAEGGATKTVSFSLPSSGTVTYHCKYHKSMHGSIAIGG